MNHFEHSRSARPYWIGYLIALVLSSGAFALVHVSSFSTELALLLIGLLGATQMLVHMHFFLHVNRRTMPVEALAALAFTAVLVVLMIGGSLWIMLDLSARMSY